MRVIKIVLLMIGILISPSALVSAHLGVNEFGRHDDENPPHHNQFLSPAVHRTFISSRFREDFQQIQPRIHRIVERRSIHPNLRRGFIGKRGDPNRAVIINRRVFIFEEIIVYDDFDRMRHRRINRRFI